MKELIAEISLLSATEKKELLRELMRGDFSGAGSGLAVPPEELLAGSGDFAGDPPIEWETAEDKEFAEGTLEEIAAKIPPHFVPPLSELRSRTRRMFREADFEGASVPGTAAFLARELEAVRYRGERNDLAELSEVYRVEGYLETFEETFQEQRHRLHEVCMAGGNRLTQSLAPRVFSIFERVCQTLHLDQTAEIFCLREPEINAKALLDRSSGRVLLGLTATTLEQLDDGELAFLLGHELGHSILGHDRLNSLLASEPGRPALTILPPFGETLFLRWRQKAEISADRLGLLACGDIASAGRALAKATFGLGERNLNLDLRVLTGPDPSPGIGGLSVETGFSVHPALPVRLKALEWFAQSAMARQAGYATGDATLEDHALEDRIEELFRVFKRHPSTPLRLATMRLVALGGLVVLGSDGEITAHEIKILLETLHRDFTDEPEGELPTSQKEILAGCDAAIAELNRFGDEDAKRFAISRLARIALADGALLREEGGVILPIALELGLSAKQVHRIIIATAQSAGFREDAKLNRAAEELRQAIQGPLLSGA